MGCVADKPNTRRLRNIDVSWRDINHDNWDISNRTNSSRTRTHKTDIPMSSYTAHRNCFYGKCKKRAINQCVTRLIIRRTNFSLSCIHDPYPFYTDSLAAMIYGNSYHKYLLLFLWFYFFIFYKCGLKLTVSCVKVFGFNKRSPWFGRAEEMVQVHNPGLLQIAGSILVETGTRLARSAPFI